MLVREAGNDDHAQLEQFLLALPVQDGGFLKADVRDGQDRENLLGKERSLQLVAVDESELVGYAAVVPSVGRSSHVAELRLVVAEGARRRGIGRALARAALLGAVHLGLEKLVVEVLAAQEDLVEMFMDLGFETEAVLRDFVRNDTGEYADLLMLVHPATKAASSLAATGIEEDST